MGMKEDTVRNIAFTFFAIFRPGTPEVFPALYA
jgi:hypothetical protein